MADTYTLATRNVQNDLTPITYRIASTRFGWLLLAGNHAGVSAVALGNEPEPLVDALRSKFPTAQLGTNSQIVNEWTNALARHLDGTVPLPELPLNVEGTSFQRRVWAELLAIPPGSTRTYGEVAARLGKPGASRAVGAACAKNALALLIPCHRVVGSKGQLGGYRWGVQLKAALLAWEKEQVK